MSPSRSEPGITEAEALADPTRLGLFKTLEGLDGSGGPSSLGVAELTDVAGVHHTVVREHLAKLRDAGLIEEATAQPSGRGRPRLLYRVSPEVRRRRAEADRYRQLSSLLAEALRLGVSAREIGRRAGSRAASQRRQESSGDQGSLELLVAESAEMGFEPALDVLDDSHADVVLNHCPFGDVAADDPETICALHRGIAEGVAEVTGDIELHSVTVVDPVRAGCRLHLVTDD